MPHQTQAKEKTVSARKLAHISLVVAACTAGCLAATASAATPTFVTTSIDDTQSFGHTSEVCGFPVLEHDVGTVTTMFTTLPDGSVRAHDIVVKITATFYSTDPNHAGTVTTRPSGPFIETDHPDGSITMYSIGQNGHVTIPGQGIVWVASGITKVEIDPNGNVPEFSHGNMSEDHTGICPLL